MDGGLCKSYRGGRLKVAAIGGKTACGSKDGDARKALHAVGAWCSPDRLCLGQVATGEKSNGTAAIPELLRILASEAALATADAVGCRKEIAPAVRARKAHYPLAVKGNQERPHDGVAGHAAGAFEAEYAGFESELFETPESGHGRKEYRRARVFSDLSGIRGRKLWPDLACFVVVATDRTVQGKGVSETRYCLRSRRPAAAEALEAARAHWGAEDNLHWVPDAAFGGDANRVRKGHGRENLNAFRKLALVAIAGADDEHSLSVRRKMAGWDEEYLIDLVLNSTEI